MLKNVKGGGNPLTARVSTLLSFVKPYPESNTTPCQCDTKPCRHDTITCHAEPHTCHPELVSGSFAEGNYSVSCRPEQHVTLNLFQGLSLIKSLDRKETKSNSISTTMVNNKTLTTLGQNEQTTRHENSVMLNLFQYLRIFVSCKLKNDKNKILKRVQDDMGWFRCGLGALAPEKNLLGCSRLTGLRLVSAMTSSFCHQASPSARNPLSPLTSHLSQKPAFTLAEMMVVMLILSIVMAAFAPVMTTRSKVDLSSPWRYMANNSDIYYGTGANQTAVIGANSKTDTASRLEISTSSDTQRHILFKRGATVLGSLYMGPTSNVAGQNSIVIGNGGITAKGVVAIGKNATANSNYSTSVGRSASATGEHSIALGYAEANGSDAIAIGRNTIANQGSIAVGYDSEATSTNAIAMGYDAESASNAVAMGNTAQATADNTVAIGANAKAKHSGTMAIGYNALTNYNPGASDDKGGNLALGYESMRNVKHGGSNLAIGSNSLAIMSSSGHSITESNSGGDLNWNTAVGHDALRQLRVGTFNVALGGGALKYLHDGAQNIAIGTNSNQALENAIGSPVSNTIAIGTSTAATANSAIAIGQGAQTKADNSVAIGSNAGSTATNGVAIGNSAASGNDGSIAIGVEANAFGYRAIALGGATADKGSAIAIGEGSQANAIGAIAIGSGTQAIETDHYCPDGDECIPAKSYSRYAIAIGTGASATGKETIALGHNAVVDPKYDVIAFNSSMAIGSGSYADGNNTNTVAVAIGPYARAIGAGAFAIGSGSVAENDAVITGGNFAIGSRCINGYNKKCLFTSDELNIRDVVIIGDGFDTVHIKGNLVVDGDVMLGRTGGVTYIRPQNSQADIAMLRVGDWDGGDENMRKAGNFTIGPFQYQDQSWTVSDKRLKYVGSELKSGLDKIRQLKVYNYTFKKDPKKTPHVGVIAQDLQKVFPNAVTTGSDGYLVIRMEDMFYALINAVKELDAKVTDLTAAVKEHTQALQQLRKENKEIKAQNKELKARLDRLERQLK